MSHHVLGEHLIEILRYIHETAIVWPLSQLYFFGPEIKGVGFWGGKSKSEICTGLSTSPQLFWLQHMDECDLLIDRNLFSFVITIEVICYMYALYKLIHSIKLSSLYCFPQRKKKRGHGNTIVLLQHGQTATTLPLMKNLFTLPKDSCDAVDQSFLKTSYQKSKDH